MGLPFKISNLRKEFGSLEEKEELKIRKRKQRDGMMMLLRMMSGYILESQVNGFGQETVSHLTTLITSTLNRLLKNK